MSENIQQEEKLRINEKMQMIREVSIEAESFYQDAIKLGDHAAHALLWTHRSQMTGLENVADTALKPSDIFDYVKRQTARRPYWQKGFQNERISFGERLKNYLEINLKEHRDTLCRTRLKIGKDSDADNIKQQQVYLMLIRQFIRQMVVQYEYRVSYLDKREGNKSTNAHA